MLIVLAAMLAISLPLSLIMGKVMFAFLSQAVDVHAFSGNINYVTQTSFFVKIVFAFWIGFLFAEVGYILGLAFKNVFVGFGAIFVCVFPLSNLAFANSWEWLNVFSPIFSLSKKIYDYYGFTPWASSWDTISSVYIVLLLMGVFIVCLLGGWLIVRNRSMYISG
jgi:hypothetical protein